ncbi:hypothetical protein An07g00140 [Aspergillus niger]|uniref:Uncharacterized protein n=2 Tax=Aspergillus niger TaxID=5061 RepID=A2QLY4_ASPNC|nr:hypothetical protein An07g00140 [Aspergillus niger]CAK39238.1 hypothetical protein An07g00140 [Aspergillus niger]
MNHVDWPAAHQCQKNKRKAALGVSKLGHYFSRSLPTPLAEESGRLGGARRFLRRPTKRLSSEAAEQAVEQFPQSHGFHALTGTVTVPSSTDCDSDKIRKAACQELPSGLLFFSLWGQQPGMPLPLG